MKNKILTSLVALISITAFAEDIELYINDRIKKSANNAKVLIILDNSGSMGATFSAKESYNPAEDYPAVGSLNAFAERMVYFTKGGVDGSSLPVPDSPSEARRFLGAINNCATARHLIETKGFYTGYIREYVQKEIQAAGKKFPTIMAQI